MTENDQKSDDSSKADAKQERPEAKAPGESFKQRGVEKRG